MMSTKMSECIGNEKLCQCMDCSYNRAEEKHLKLCLEQDEGQPNDNDSGWDY